jgi:hypothetical protein
MLKTPPETSKPGGYIHPKHVRLAMPSLPSGLQSVLSLSGQSPEHSEYTGNDGGRAARLSADAAPEDAKPGLDPEQSDDAIAFLLSLRDRPPPTVSKTRTRSWPRLVYDGT